MAFRENAISRSPRFDLVIAGSEVGRAGKFLRELESRGRSGVLNRALGALHVHLATPSAHFHALAARSGTFGRPFSILCLIVEKVRTFFWALLHLRHLDMGTRVAAMYICASECQFEVAKWALRALFIKSATPSALHNVGLACGGREVDLHARSPHEC